MLTTICQILLNMAVVSLSSTSLLSIQLKLFKLCAIINNKYDPTLWSLDMELIFAGYNPISLVTQLIREKSLANTELYVTSNLNFKTKRLLTGRRRTVIFLQDRQ